MLEKNIPKQEGKTSKITEEFFDIDQGPVHLRLGKQKLKIVDPIRDLGQKGWNTDVLVIDPESFVPGENGYAGVWDNESFILGRDSKYGRFDFDDTVSRQHVEVSKVGKLIHIKDLDSTNGTFLELSDTDQEGENKNQIKFYGATSSEKSDRHEVNEDAVLGSDSHGAIGVFDGVGGDSGSERASSTASKTAYELIKDMDIRMEKAAALEAFSWMIYEVNTKVFNERNDNGGRVTTTGTIAKIFTPKDQDPFLSVASVGDSRCYVYRDGELKCLTVDNISQEDDDSLELEQMRIKHEFLSSVEREQEMSEANKRLFNGRNMISRWLGCRDEELRPDVFTFDIKPGDIIFTTTDGITDNLTDKEIAEIITDKLSQKQGLQEITDSILGKSYHRSKDKTHLRAKEDDYSVVALTPYQA